MYLYIAYFVKSTTFATVMVIFLAIIALVGSLKSFVSLEHSISCSHNEFVLSTRVCMLLHV